ncbi:hypothetical protein PFLUV_G00061280 [Perca fluviatilis]|uniref:Uncharacterized protein n=1 Tax=Perca fluviatilis TaxID=8168 RepID=A0A6A5FFT0_PERFL|nr:hypothetical protein PFLUV_G00061280 [Perca fluviatilis]
MSVIHQPRPRCQRLPLLCQSNTILYSYLWNCQNIHSAHTAKVTKLLLSTKLKKQPELRSHVSCPCALLTLQRDLD